MKYKLGEKMAEAPALDQPDHEAINAADTLMKAHEIKANEDLMGRVRKHAGRKLKALAGLKNDIKSIDDIRKVGQKKFGPQNNCIDCGKKMSGGECPGGCDSMGA